MATFAFATCFARPSHADTITIDCTLLTPGGGNTYSPGDNNVEARVKVTASDTYHATGTLELFKKNVAQPYFREVTQTNTVDAVPSPVDSQFRHSLPTGKDQHSSYSIQLSDIFVDANGDSHYTALADPAGRKVFISPFDVDYKKEDETGDPGPLEPGDR